MTSEDLFSTLKSRFIEVLKANGIEREPVEVICRSLSPEEAIGTPGRQDFPILTGKDVMIQAEFRGCRGQAFTDAPASFSGTLSDILDMDIVHDAHARGLFVAVMNAVMESLGLCRGTVHCRTEGPELCSQKMKAWLAEHRPDAEKITLVGYQPALLEMLGKSGYQVRVLDLNPQNIGQVCHGVTVEDGAAAMQSAIDSADLILCTGSTLCNGTIVDYMLPDKDVLFFGTSAAGASKLLGLNRVCFAHEFDESSDASVKRSVRPRDNAPLHGNVIYGQNEITEVEKSPEHNNLKEEFHTFEEYLALPDERRVELIDGHFYDMASPNGIHQQITFMLWRAFFECIETHKMPCKVQGAPFDVRLDDYTVVQPDVMVFCGNPSQAFAVRATTPPDLVIEILSKSTAFKDRHLKLFKYRNAGVREVWLVSPDDRTVEIYLFTESEKEPITYSFDDKIPVHISEHKCVIDFAEINKRLPPL